MKSITLDAVKHHAHALKTISFQCQTILKNSDVIEKTFYPSHAQLLELVARCLNFNTFSGLSHHLKSNGSPVFKTEDLDIFKVEDIFAKLGFNKYENFAHTFLYILKIYWDKQDRALSENSYSRVFASLGAKSHTPLAMQISNLSISSYDLFPEGHITEPNDEMAIRLHSHAYISMLLDCAIANSLFDKLNDQVVMNRDWKQVALDLSKLSFSIENEVLINALKRIKNIPQIAGFSRFFELKNNQIKLTGYGVFAALSSLNSTSKFHEASELFNKTVATEINIEQINHDYHFIPAMSRLEFDPDLVMESWTNKNYRFTTFIHLLQTITAFQTYKGHIDQVLNISLGKDVLNEIVFYAMIPDKISPLLWYELYARYKNGTLHELNATPYVNKSYLHAGHQYSLEDDELSLKLCETLQKPQISQCVLAASEKKSDRKKTIDLLKTTAINLALDGNDILIKSDIFNDESFYSELKDVAKTLGKSYTEIDIANLHILDSGWLEKGESREIEDVCSKGGIIVFKNNLNDDRAKNVIDLIVAHSQFNSIRSAKRTSYCYCFDSNIGYIDASQHIAITQKIMEVGRRVSLTMVYLLDLEIGEDNQDMHLLNANANLRLGLTDTGKLLVNMN